MDRRNRPRRVALVALLAATLVTAACARSDDGQRVESSGAQMGEPVPADESSTTTATGAPQPETATTTTTTGGATATTAAKATTTAAPRATTTTTTATAAGGGTSTTTGPSVSPLPPVYP